MFKLVALSALITLAAAIPSGILAPHAIIAERSHITYQEPTLAKVGHYVESIPTAVSHQYQTVVHNKAKIITPIVAPAIKTYTAPIVKTYAAHLPYVKSFLPTYGAVPLIHHL